MTGCRLWDKICDTGVDFEKCTLNTFWFFFLDKYVGIPKALRFFLFFTKSFFLPDFQQYLYIRVVNSSTLKLDELKLLIFWPFIVQTTKSNICLKLYKIKFTNFLYLSQKIFLLHKILSKGMILQKY